MILNMLTEWKVDKTELILGITIPLAVVLVAVILLILYFSLKKRRKNVKEVENHIDIDDNVFFAFGGKDNIKSVELKGSRLVIELFDQTKFEKEFVKDKGIDRVLVMSNKITLVGENVEEIYKLFNK